MAEVLTTKGLAHELENIIRKAQKEITLISYSFKIDDTYINHIKSASGRNVKIKIIYGEKVNKENLRELKNIRNIEILHQDGLHAKIYANEDKCIIGSMNLYDYSEHNNIEIGCLLTLENDKEAFNEAITHCSEIYKRAKGGEPDTKNTGYCIRTGGKIPFNIKHPLCATAYKAWSEYENPDYPEKYCHYSGEPSHGKTSYGKPILEKNWKKAKQVQGVRQ